MTPYVDDQDFTLYVGDVRDVLAGLPAESVHCCVTSPPYWGLRDYGTGSWVGGDDGCDHEARRRRRDAQANPGSGSGAGGRTSLRDGVPAQVCPCGARRVDHQLGLEPTPEEYVANMVAVFREVRRVLRRDGTCWLNIGDSYAARIRQSGEDHAGELSRGRGVITDYTRPLPNGLKEKDLVGIPWRLAFALQADGWYLRSDIIWSKPNPMPESVTDRPTKAHEFVFLLTRSPRYYFDNDAIREPHSPDGRLKTVHDHGTPNSHENYDNVGNGNERWPNGGRNKRSVWEIATQPYPDAHFACVDERTQALTPLGWKYHDEIRHGDHIATYDPDTDSCRFTPATVHRYDYDGDLVAIEKRDISQRLTPNHRCLIRHRSGKTAVVEASDLTPGMEVMTVAPLEPDWRDKSTFGDTEPELAALIGWFVAEGHVTSIKRLSIYQSQSANPQHVETIRDLLGVTGGDWTESTRHRAYLGRGGLTATSSEVEFVVRGPLALIMQELAPAKRLHEGVLGMTRTARAAMLDALIDGDGHRRSDGRACIVQKDAHQIGVMQSLALSLDYRAIVSQRKDGNHVLHLTRGRWLTLRSTNGRHVPIGREHYEGIVWCPSVETGFWLARRNGRPFITGNTFPQALVEPCVLAGTSERGCCPVCGAPWERETETEYDAKGRTTNGPRSLAQRHETAGFGQRLEKRVETIGWRPTCEHLTHLAGEPTPYEDVYAPAPCTVLDPFMGSGTTALVARRHGRRSIGIELNGEYAELAAKRLQQLSLLA